MSKKKKHRKASGSEDNPDRKIASKSESRKKNHRYHYIIIAALGLVFYGNTLKNGFAFDDSVVITGNSFTKQGIKGIPDLVTKDLFAGIYGKSLELAGGRYRPIPLVTHAIEYNFWQDKHPGYDHLVNILFYILAGMLLFTTLRKILKDKDVTAFVTTLLFMAHPIHTEVVANIKSRDEILCFIFLILTLYYLFRFTEEKTRKYFGYSLLFYLLSLFTKEHGITFIAVIPLTLYFFTDEKTKDILKRTLPYLALALFYLFLRSQILNTSVIKDSADVMENPFYGVAIAEKLATIMHILGKYLLLLFFPHPLSCDYSFNQIPYISFGNIDAIVPLLVYTSITVFAIMKFRSKNIFSFCILFFLAGISIVSNIFFNIGAPMGERFAFIPSLGFCLALAALLMRSLKQNEDPGSIVPAKLMFPLALLMIPSAYKTISRNSDWKNNETLFATDVQTVPKSGKANYYYGNVLWNYYNDSLTSRRRPYLLNAAKHYNLIAAGIAPEFFHAHLNIGKIYMEENKADSAIIHLTKVTEIIPPSTTKLNGSTRISASEKYIEAMQNLARCWAMLKNQPDEGIKILNIALQYGPKNASTLEYLGICYAMKGDNNAAMKYYNESLAINPENSGIYYNLGKMYEYAKDDAKAKEYFQKADAIKNKRP